MDTKLYKLVNGRLEECDSWARSREQLYVRYEDYDLMEGRFLSLVQELEETLRCRGLWVQPRRKGEKGGDGARLIFSIAKALEDLLEKGKTDDNR